MNKFVLCENGAEFVFNGFQTHTLPYKMLENIVTEI